MRLRFLIPALALAACLSASAAYAERARAKAKPPEPAPPQITCARGSYPGDPVCFGADDGRDLPTPSAGAIYRKVEEDVRINDQLTVRGADPKEMSKQPVHINNPNPNPRKQDVGGGAGVNYRF